VSPGVEPATAADPPRADPLTTAALAARHGDPAALRVFLAGTQGPVRRFCAAMVPDLDPDDLVQETYLRAWWGLGGFRGESSVTTWLMSIARRVGIEAVTRAARQRRSDGQAGAGARSKANDMVDMVDPRHPVDMGDTVELTDLIGRLEPERREALVLTQLVGLTYAEAARVAECEIGTVRSRVFRARRQLVEWLSEDPGTFPPSRSTNP
jgi:RNA polymerase sigma-70 factor, ECF subfamily